MKLGKLISYSVRGDAPRAGLVVDQDVHDVGALLGEPPRGWIHWLDRWDAVRGPLEDELTRAAPGHRLDEVRLHAPLLYPGALYCAGANYADHLLEMTGKPPEPPEGRDPYFFLKPPRATIVGPGEPIRLPAGSAMVDWEAEIALVVARRARDLPPERALDCILGLTLLHDVSARDRADRGGDTPAFRWDWVGSKAFPTAAPMGPWIVPIEQIGDLADIPLRLSVNGVIKQDSNSRQLVHGFAQLTAYLSRACGLFPGDVIATGTPAGVGLPRGEFLKSGDMVEIESGPLGRLTNPVT
jgi:2-keto-4-pentenoate hydratase/2-oxohepta-3-ene-1,7-dioic acid hydratase in catechol pathway